MVLKADEQDEQATDDFQGLRHQVCHFEANLLKDIARYGKCNQIATCSHQCLCVDLLKYIGHVGEQQEIEEKTDLHKDHQDEVPPKVSSLELGH